MMHKYAGYILRFLLPVLAVTVLLCAICSCGKETQKKPTIAVSILPQKYLLEKIVGDKYAVVCLLTQGSNPETFEPNTSHLLNLEMSDAYFMIGNIGFEQAISNRLRTNNPDLRIFDTSAGIDYIQGTHDLDMSLDEHEHHYHPDDCHCHHHDSDPHVWSSVKNAHVLSTNMLNALMSIDPDNSNYYLKNFNALTDSLNILDASLDSILTPVKGYAFGVWHPSLSYFARDYGLNQVSLQTAGKEESIKGYKNRIDTAKNDSILVFFYQQEFDSRQAESISKEIGVEPIAINPLNAEWDKELIHTAKAIANAKR